MREAGERRAQERDKEERRGRGYGMIRQRLGSCLFMETHLERITGGAPGTRLRALVSVDILSEGLGGAGRGWAGYPAGEPWAFGGRMVCFVGEMKTARFWCFVFCSLVLCSTEGIHIYTIMKYSHTILQEKNTDMQNTWRNTQKIKPINNRDTKVRSIQYIHTMIHKSLLCVMLPLFSSLC